MKALIMQCIKREQFRGREGAQSNAYSAKMEGGPCTSSLHVGKGFSLECAHDLVSNVHIVMSTLYQLLKCYKCAYCNVYPLPTPAKSKVTVFKTTPTFKAQHVAEE